MKSLSLSVPGYNIPVPTDIRGISPGSYGQNLLQVGLNLLFIAAFILALLFLLFGGIQWIISGGDKTKIEKARNTLTYAIVGLILVLLALFIINLIGGLFGTNLTQR